MTEDEMVGWHHRLNGCEFEQTVGDRAGLESLVCYSPWGRQELDTTERLNNNHGENIMELEFQQNVHEPWGPHSATP